MAGRDDWFVYRPGDKPLGPLSLQQIAEGLVSGKMAASSLVALGGDPRWRLATDIPAIVDAKVELEKKGALEPPPSLPSFPPQLDPETTQELLAIDADIEPPPRPTHPPPVILPPVSVPPPPLEPQTPPLEPVRRKKTREPRWPMEEDVGKDRLVPLGSFVLFAVIAVIFVIVHAAGGKPPSRAFTPPATPAAR